MKSRSVAGFFAVPAFLAALAGCGEDSDPGSRVVSFRVLAEQVDVPYAAPGTTAHVSSLSYDPTGRTVTWAWAVCPNPESASVASCVARISNGSGTLTREQLLAFGPGVDTVDVPIPTDALSGLPAGGRPAAALGVLSAACPGELTLAVGAAGLPFRCVDAASGRELGLDEFVVGVKRIPVRERDVNQNPSIARVLFDGIEWPQGELKELVACGKSGNIYADCGSGTKHKLAVQLSPESFESGTDEFGRAFNEAVAVQYYATGGIYESDTRIASDSTTGFTARAQDKAQELTVWIVVRDDRGGVTWTERHVQVR